MPTRFTALKTDRFALVRPGVDAHTLGVSTAGQLLSDCGYAHVAADAALCRALDDPNDPRQVAAVVQWLRDQRITVLGFSYRLDPAAGAELWARWIHRLKEARLLAQQGGRIRALFFAGLPAACRLVAQRHPEVAGVFSGDETPGETLGMLGIEHSLLPAGLTRGVAYDEDRLSFGKELIARGDYLSVSPPSRGGYGDFGTQRDTLVARLRHYQACGRGPVIRAHIGPYLGQRDEAVKLFLDWCRRLAASGFLDVLSIGTSQLTQSAFGEDWADRPNGGGVPLNRPEEFAAVWEASRPMLVRTYAGTQRVADLARMYDEKIHTAWHALSLWWFCQIDGRGPLAVRDNLRQHVETLRYIASAGTPFEPNVSHHFAFRGADDLTYIVSAVLAARLAKSLGIRWLVLQNMLNTPKCTWGVQDLAKSRALLALVRPLEDERFGIVLQPRGGLDYFSPDAAKAKAQLAAVTALMDDIEPDNPQSPGLIHVVSYSEGSNLADPAVVDESIQITRWALQEYRALRQKGRLDDMSRHSEVASRTEALLAGARELLAGIEAMVPHPYSADGLYRVFQAGFLPVPHLWECRDEFRHAVSWQTRPVNGGIQVVDEQGQIMSVAQRLGRVAAALPPAMSV